MDCDGDLDITGKALGTSERRRRAGKSAARSRVPEKHARRVAEGRRAARSVRTKSCRPRACGAVSEVRGPSLVLPRSLCSFSPRTTLWPTVGTRRRVSSPSIRRRRATRRSAHHVRPVDITRRWWELRFRLRIGAPARCRGGSHARVHRVGLARRRDFRRRALEPRRLRLSLSCPSSRAKSSRICAGRLSEPDTLVLFRLLGRGGGLYESGLVRYGGRRLEFYFSPLFPESSAPHGGCRRP